MTTMTSLTCLLVIAEARELLLYFAVVHSKLFNNKSNTILCYGQQIFTPSRAENALKRDQYGFIHVACIKS